MSTAAPPQLPQHPDPFEGAGDPGRYVPRPAMERVLAELVQCAAQEGCMAVLSGAPGTGKTLLLRLLAQRLAPRLRCVVLPYAALPAPALCAWALDLLAESPSYDPVGAIVGQARRTDAPGLVLLVDNAESIAPDTARELARAADAAGGALRLVAASEESGLRLLEVAWPGARQLPPIEPMSAEETATYLAAHLGGLAPEIVERAGFDAEFVAELHRASGGVPARVNAMASQHLLRAVRGAPRRAPPATAQPAKPAAAQPAEPAPPDTAPPTPAPSPATTAPRLPEPPPLPPPPEWAREEDERQEPPRRPPAREARPAPPTASEADAAQSALERAAGRLALAHGPGGHEVPGEGLEPGFERAVGRLALSEDFAAEGEGTGAEGARGPRGGSPSSAPKPERGAGPPAPGSAPAAAGPDIPRATPAPVTREATQGTKAPTADSARRPAPPTAARTATAPRRAPGPRRRPRMARAAAVLAIAFAGGTGASLLWLGAEPTAPPTAEVPTAPTPAPQPAAEVPATPTPQPTAAAPLPAGAAAPAPLAAELAEASPVVEVGINATPWATIRVDGREVGVTPLSGVALSPGPHLFEARLPDGRVLSREVRVDAENRFVVFP